MSPPGESSQQQAVSPAEMVERVETMTRQRFLMYYGDTELLLIRLMSDSAELEETLVAQQEKHNVPVKPSQHMGFHTEVYSEVQHSFRGSPDSKTSLPPHAGPEAIIDLFRRDRYFVVPLRKRASADTLYAERISLGRAHNKDIVLRHSSVSKFHGWFELDEATKRFRYADAGSRNGTSINGEGCPTRDLVPVGHGDEIVFGRVTARVCSAEVFFDALKRR